MPAEMQELMQSLSHTTARLARVENGEPEEIEKALVERGRAIDALCAWIARERAAGRAIGHDLASQLVQELESGSRTLLRLAVDREVLRHDRMALDRELQVLHGIRGSETRSSGQLSCRG